MNKPTTTAAAFTTLANEIQNFFTLLGMFGCFIIFSVYWVLKEHLRVQRAFDNFGNWLTEDCKEEFELIEVNKGVVDE